MFDDATAEPLPAGRLNFDIEWRAALNEAIDQSGRSRDEIAAEMSRLLGATADQRFSVTKAHLDAWTAASRSQWRFPVIYLPAFMEATGADWLLQRVARFAGLHVVDDGTLQLARLGQTEIEIQRLQGRGTLLRHEIGGRS